MAAATTYRYRVRAADAVPNLSGYSSIQNATTQAGPDTQAPSVPTGLSATPVSATQINLAWSASTDNVGVTGYRVERCLGATCSNFVQVGTPTGTSFDDTGLAAATTYRYRVRAADAVPNLSGYSSIQNATTQAAAGYAGADGADGTLGDACLREPDQFGLDGVDRQRRRDRLSGRALPGRGLLELRPGGDSDRARRSTTPGWRRRRRTGTGCGPRMRSPT